MFGKRRRAASNPPQRAPPPSASASLAASKAFIKNAESNGDLSSAAAAAALRTHVTTPTPVGETVTKRMARRGSHSSNGSYSRQQPGSLQRQTSSGSMAERSFRAPSPGRGSPAGSNAPPVPPVPKNIQQQSSTVHRRASSLEPAYRGGSPAPRVRGRGVSLDRGASNAGRGTQRPANHLAQVSEEEDALRSVNFSRPMTPGTPAAKQNPSPPTTSGWFGGPVVNKDAVQRMASTSRPKTSSGVSTYDLQSAQRAVQNAAERPVSTHQISQGAEGARLSSGSMRAKPSGAAVQSQSYLPRQAPRPVDPNSPDAVYDPSTRKFIHKQDAMARHRELHEEPEPTRQYVPQHVDTFHSVHIPENQMGRGSPSPIRHYVRQEQPAPQRREETLPQADTTPRRNEPAALYANEPRAVVERHSDEFADADVQFQEQANISRRLEDSGYGTIVGQDEETASPVVAKNQDSAYPRLSTPVNSRPASTYSGHDRERLGHDRNASLSPPRNAHFAPVAIELTGLKHDPLPRSVSPAKSALKASPSVSRRGESPIASNGRLYGRFASSEASDTASDDGTRRKKKTVRVSFEEDPIVVGKAAHADTETSIQGGLGASKWSPIAEKEDEFEDLMKPRPALPLFGSIREKDRHPREDVAEKVTETVSASPNRDPSHVSSDVALGNIVAHDHARKQTESGAPLPPEVTTVEGSGYASDSSDYSDTHKPMDHGATAQQPPAPEPKSLSTPYEDISSGTSMAEQTAHVPNIALQPATPSPYEKPEPQFQSMAIPGRWDEDGTQSRDQKAQSDAYTSSIPSARSTEPTSQQSQSVSFEDEESSDDNSSVYSDAYEDLSDGGGFGSIDALMERPVASSSSGLMHSKYADQAATDGSTSKSGQDIHEEKSDDEMTTPMQDWNAAQLHWRSLNASRQQPQIETPVKEPSHAQEVVDRVMQAPVSQAPAVTAQPPEHALETMPERKVAAVAPPRTSTSSTTSTKPLKSALKKTPAPQTTRPAETQTRTTMRTAAPREGSSEIHMKRTMRGGPDTNTQPEPRMGTTMRSSMRGAPQSTPRAQPQMRQSMRSADTSPTPNMGLAASRHSMVPTDAKSPRGALQKKNIPPSAAISKARPQSMPVAKPKAAPVPTYDSDSDASASSFQRTRRGGSRDQGGRYTMRGSMRQEPAPTMRASAPAPKQVRAISPPGSPSPAMRRSMRPSSPTPEQVKSSKFSIRSLSPMGRFRKGSDVRPSSPSQPKPMPSFAKQPKPVKQKAPAAKAPKATKTPFKSRFADSSDEDEDDRPTRFRSRFDDSDDDDDEPADYKLPPGLTPVRGIPRKAGEEDGDSTDLEEEADEEAPNAVSTPGPVTNGTNGNTGAQGKALSAGSLRDSKHAPLPSFESGGKGKGKRGFFGLGKKKTTQQEPVEAQPEMVQHTSAPDEIPMPPAQRNRDKNFPMTPIDEDKEFGEDAPTSPKRSPKLQRRSTPEWPLPSTIGIEDRPMSSDGVAARRPRFATRQPSAVSNVSAPIVDANGRSVSYGRSGKKKKFQGLRRVFGLND